MNDYEPTEMLIGAPALIKMRLKCLIWNENYVNTWIQRKYEFVNVLNVVDRIDTASGQLTQEYWNEYNTNSSYFTFSLVNMGK